MLLVIWCETAMDLGFSDGKYEKRDINGQDVKLVMPFYFWELK